MDLRKDEDRARLAKEFGEVEVEPSRAEVLELRCEVERLKGHLEEVGKLAAEVAAANGELKGLIAEWVRACNELVAEKARLERENRELAEGLKQMKELLRRHVFELQVLGHGAVSH